MRICIVGAGAVGGNFATRLAAAGATLCVIARGDTLRAIERDGLTLHAGDRALTAKVRAAASGAALGVQDVVVTTVKATDPDGLAKVTRGLIGPATRVVFAQNGIPWWYADGWNASSPPPDLGFLDPNGALRALVPMERVAAGVISSSNEVVAPGIVRNVSPERNRLHVARADGTAEDPVLDQLRALLGDAGIDSPPVADIRQIIWGKLTLNISSSSVCLLTGHRLSILKEDAALGELAMRAAGEAMAIVAALGIDGADFDPERLRREPPPHLPSLRQDYERGAALELDALMLAPLAIARAVGVATPVLQTLATLAVRAGIDRGVYPPRRVP